jgi:hypothetical protein
MIRSDCTLVLAYRACNDCQVVHGSICCILGVFGWSKGCQVIFICQSALAWLCDALHRHVSFFANVGKLNISTMQDTLRASKGTGTPHRAHDFASGAAEGARSGRSRVVTKWLPLARAAAIAVPYTDLSAHD